MSEIVAVNPEARRVWKQASGFPPDKESVYSEHRVVQEFDVHVGKKVLEYGCGGGSDTMSFLRRGNEVWFCDIVSENIETTSRRTKGEYGDRAHGVFLEHSAPVPLPSGLVDVASSHGVLHHIPHPEPVLAEIRRVTKDGGLLYVMLYTEMLFEKSRRHMDSLVGRGMDRCRAFCQCTDGDGPYARAYTEAEGRAFIEAAGYVVEYAKIWNNQDFRTFKAVAI